MIRRFNYTGRRKLVRQRVAISIIDQPPHKSFNANLNLKGLGLSDEARVYVEPYYKSSFMRFDFGTVGDIQTPGSTALTDIPPTSLIRFRVKIVDETKRLGRIIRVAEMIRPSNSEESGNRMSILHIDWEQDLDQQIFRVTFHENDYPRLEINRRIDNARDLVKADHIFRSLVFPVAVRQVVEQIFLTSDVFEVGDSSWQSTWLKFFSDALRVNVEIDFEDPNVEDKSHFIEEVVGSFCRMNKVRTMYQQTINA